MKIWNLHFTKPLFCNTLQDMKNIKTVSLAGAGAVGAVIADSLTAFLGKQNVQILADGERLERYRHDGLFLDGRKLDFNYVSPQEAKTSDLVIIATKNLQLQSAIELIKTSVAKDTIILSVLNGIQSEKDLAEVFGENAVMYGFVLSLNSIHEKNQIRCSDRGCVIFGENDNSKSERALALCSIFEQSGIKYKNPDDIHLEQWKKFLLNVTFNTISALCRSTYGGFNFDCIKDLVRLAGNEVIQVANAEGVALCKKNLEDDLALCATWDPLGETSMLQDFKAGRKSENEWFCGTIVNLGEKHNISVPVCSILKKLVEGTEKARELRV